MRLVAGLHHQRGQTRPPNEGRGFSPRRHTVVFSWKPRVCAQPRRRATGVRVVVKGEGHGGAVQRQRAAWHRGPHAPRRTRSAPTSIREVGNEQRALLNLENRRLGPRTARPLIRFGSQDDDREAETTPPRRREGERCKPANVGARRCKLVTRGRVARPRSRARRYRRDRQRKHDHPDGRAQLSITRCTRAAA